MFITSVVADPIIIGLVLSVPSTALAIMGMRRANKLDKAAVKTAATTIANTDMQRVLDGLDSIILNLQTDNTAQRLISADARALAESLTKQLQDCRDAFYALKNKKPSSNA